MELVRIYQCLCDRTRLRILNLLLQGPLCVCHLQRTLREPQAKVSKHLRYLKARGLVEASKAGNWRIYRLPTRRPAQLGGESAVSARLRGGGFDLPGGCGQAQKNAGTPTGRSSVLRPDSRPNAPTGRRRRLIILP